MDAVTDSSHLYAVERRVRHAERPGFRITELQIAPSQRVPWHYHTRSKTPSTCSRGGSASSSATPGRGAARARRDLRGPARPPPPRDQRRRRLGHLPGPAGHRRVRLRAPAVTRRDPLAPTAGRRRGEERVAIPHERVTTAMGFDGYRIVQHRGVVRGLVVRSRSVVGHPRRVHPDALRRQHHALHRALRARPAGRLRSHAAARAEVGPTPSSPCATTPTRSPRRHRGAGVRHRGRHRAGRR